MDSPGFKIVALIAVMLVIGLYADPTLANWFETIGGGVAGSRTIKLEHLRMITFVTGGIFLVASALTVITHKRNAQTLNYTMWKSSAMLFFILGSGALTAGYFI